MSPADPNTVGMFVRESWPRHGVVDGIDKKPPLEANWSVAEFRRLRGTSAQYADGQGGGGKGSQEGSDRQEAELRRTCRAGLRGMSPSCSAQSDDFEPIQSSRARMVWLSRSIRVTAVTMTIEMAAVRG